MLPGDVVISELMVDPAGDDAEAEWIELYNVSSSALLLDRLVIEVWGGTYLSRHDVVGFGYLAPHGYAVLSAGSQDFSRQSYDDLTFVNHDGRVVILCEGHVIDEVFYGALQDMPSGHSVSFDGAMEPDALVNDDIAHWCAGERSYAEKAYGTPGEPNDPCLLRPCLGEQGFRESQIPAAGGLMFSEIFADAPGADGGNEWIELFVSSQTVVDLNDIELLQTRTVGETTRRWQVRDSVCHSFGPEAYIVVGFAADPTAARVPADIVLAGDSLYNDESIWTLWLFDVLIDRAVVPAATSGVATAIDRDKVGDARNNDFTRDFCAAQTTGLFGAGFEAGTPGRPNDSCSN